MFRFVPFAMSVLEQNEATGWDVSLVSVTGLVFGDPSSLTVSTRPGTVCQSTCRAPAGMRVKLMCVVAYLADTSKTAALG
jgi:hypothetical protein